MDGDAMTSEELEIFLELTLGEKMATEITWEAGADPASAVDVLHRKAGTLAVPFRAHHDEKRHFGRVRKDVKLLELTAKLLDEMVYEFDEDYDVELVRSA